MSIGNKAIHIEVARKISYDVLRCTDGLESPFSVIKVLPFPVAVTLVAFIASAWLDLRADSTCTFKNIIQKRQATDICSESCYEPFHPGEDISTVRLIPVFVSAFFMIFYMIVCSSFNHSSEV